MSRTLHLFGTDSCATMVPIRVIRWYRLLCHDGTVSCATVVPIRRYCQITGKEVRLTGINFQPEKKLIEEVGRKVKFVRSRYSSQSTQYTEEKLLGKIKEYLQENRYITCKIMRFQFGLTQYTAQKWLNLFCDKGILVKDGTPRSPIYFLNKSSFSGND